jgi:hypothetical protein
MEPEKTIEEKVEQAVSEVRDAMIENIKASRMEIDIASRKAAARYTLQKAKERLSNLESELGAL